MAASEQPEPQEATEHSNATSAYPAMLFFLLNKLKKVLTYNLGYGNMGADKEMEVMKMNEWIAIAIEVMSLTGYKTIKKIAMLPRHEALKKLANEDIVRRFKDPFNSSIEVVVVR